jgi:hypothetical protein
MKSKQLAQKSLLSLALIGAVSLPCQALMAEQIDITDAKKDLKVMSRIIETSLESSSDRTIVRARIEGTYLAKQGYLFSVQLNGLGAIGVPGIASWDSGRLELDIPAIITEALTEVDYSMANIAPDIDADFGELVEPIIAGTNSFYKDKEVSSKLKKLRDMQRQARRDIYQLRRDIRREQEEVKRKDLNQELDMLQEQLNKYDNEYQQTLESYKQKKISSRVASSNKAVDAIFTSFCDYGQSMKALKVNEKVTIMIKGAIGDKGKRQTNVYVLEQEDVTECRDPLKLKSSAVNYVL